MNNAKEYRYHTKLIIFFMLATIVIVLTGVYNYYSLNVFMSNATTIYEDSEIITNLYEEVEETQHNFELYLAKKSSKYSIEFYKNSENLTKKYQSLLEQDYYTSSNVKIKNLAYMVVNYNELMNETVYNLRINGENYKEDYEETVKLYMHIREYMQEIMSSELSDSTERYSEIQKEIKHTEIMSNSLYVIVIVIVLVSIVLFSFEITKPINELADASKKVADGNFDISLASENITGEMAVLYKNFNKMTESIAKYLEQLEKRQTLEEKLHDEKVNNLNMKSALHEAELLALQSQVDPHFIFNTINIGAKIAMMNDDEVTCDYLENAADIFRYNLRGLDSIVSIEEEVNNASSYINLLQTRFGDILKFELDIEDEGDIKDIIVPKMTLQPLVENAYIHGVGKNEDGGTILIRTRKLTAECVFLITIGNTGEPIKKDIIDRILYQQTDEGSDVAKRRGHTTGIGVSNVLKRLRIYFKVEDVMNITYENGMNHFTIKIPLRNNYDE